MMYIYSVILLILLAVQPTFAGGSLKTIALDMRVEEYARSQPILHHLRAGDTITVPSFGWMSRRFTMLCPQIYFPPDEITPMPEYIVLQPNSAQKFNPDTLFCNGIEVNNQVLNIIGYRMRQMPDAVLRLSVSPYSASCFGEADSIGTLRMKYIRDYLISVWEITPERIVIPSSGKKKFIQNTNEPWRNCQRYVRMSSDTPELLFAVKRENTKIITEVEQVQIAPHDIRIDSSEIHSVIVLFDLDGKEISQLACTNFPVIIPYFYGEFFYDDVRPNGMQCKVILTNGDTLLSSRSPLNITPTKIDDPRKEYRSCMTGHQRYSLYWGNAESTSLTSAQVKELRVMLPFALFEHTGSIYISGYTERTHNKRRNEKVATLRAKAVEKVVRSLLPDNNRIEIESVGSEENYPLFDTSSPMENSMNNCVAIRILAEQP